MKKKITRIGKTIIAEVYHVIVAGGRDCEVLIDSKRFNDFSGDLLNMEPKQKHYDKENAWCDNLISLHLKNTK